jgi:hypothetical protein
MGATPGPRDRGLSSSTEDESKVLALADIMRETIKLTGTRMPDEEAIVTAARRVANNWRLKIELKL